MVVIEEDFALRTCLLTYILSVLEEAVMMSSISTRTSSKVAEPEHARTYDRQCDDIR